MARVHDFGPQTWIGAEAQGEPGRRRFRLMALSPAGESASLWLEKEQLAALGEALRRTLMEEGYAQGSEGWQPDPVFPLRPSAEFAIARLSMGLNRGGRRIALIASESAEPDDDSEAVSLEFDFDMASALAARIADIVAAGRPPCPLCGGPLDPSGHICPRRNGHHARGEET